MMKRFRQAAVPVVVVFGLAACASTDIRSQVDAAIANAGGYQKIMVFVAIDELGLRQDAENEFEKRLADGESVVVPAHQLFFPGREYSAEELGATLADAGVGGVLVVQPATSGTQVTRGPKRTTTEVEASAYGNRLSGTATTTESGGYRFVKPWAKYEAVLHDATSGEVVWVASMSSGGNAFADWGDLIRSMARKTADQLLEDGVLH